MMRRLYAWLLPIGPIQAITTMYPPGLLLAAMALAVNIRAILAAQPTMAAVAGAFVREDGP